MCMTWQCSRATVVSALANACWRWPKRWRARGACKLTLEVLSGNAGAQRLYQRVGFANYQLDPAAGQAQLLQKWLD